MRLRQAVRQFQIGIRQRKPTETYVSRRMAGTTGGDVFEDRGRGRGVAVMQMLAAQLQARRRVGPARVRSAP